MTLRDTADRQLERLLHILPAAAREGGAVVGELARELGVGPDTVLRDLEEVTTRSFYHPAGGAEELQIQISGDRVEVWTAGEFRRPVRLSPREALAVALGLRVLARDRGEGADEADDEAPRRRALRARIEAELSTGELPGGLEGSLEPADAGPDPEGIRHRLIQAARDRRICRIDYLKVPAPEPEERTIHPLVLVQGEGEWYAVAWAPARDGVRVFRLDRIVEVEVLDEPFEPPEGFRLDDYLSGRRVFHGDDALEVTVRYAPRIARWIRERDQGREEPDGSLTVTHRVMDPTWIVRRVLGYGGDAVVEEPEEVRRLVREVAGGVP